MPLKGCFNAVYLLCCHFQQYFDLKKTVEIDGKTNLELFKDSLKKMTLFRVIFFTPAEEGNHRLASPVNYIA
jgi:hypothetical protein